MFLDHFSSSMHFISTYRSMGFSFFIFSFPIVERSYEFHQKTQLYVGSDVRAGQWHEVDRWKHIGLSEQPLRVLPGDEEYHIRMRGSENSGVVRASRNQSLISSCLISPLNHFCGKSEHSEFACDHCRSTRWTGTARTRAWAGTASTSRTPAPTSRSTCSRYGLSVRMTCAFGGSGWFQASLVLPNARTLPLLVVGTTSGAQIFDMRTQKLLEQQNIETGLNVGFLAHLRPYSDRPCACTKAAVMNTVPLDELTAKGHDVSRSDPFWLGVV